MKILFARIYFSDARPNTQHIKSLVYNIRTDPYSSTPRLKLGKNKNLITWRFVSETQLTTPVSFTHDEPLSVSPGSRHISSRNSNQLHQKYSPTFTIIYSSILWFSMILRTTPCVSRNLIYCFENMKQNRTEN